MHTSLLKSASVLCSVWTVSFAVTLGSARMSSINLTTRSRPACCSYFSNRSELLPSREFHVIVDRVLPMHTSLLKSASVLCSVWTVSFPVTLGSARMSSINLTTRSRPACFAYFSNRSELFPSREFHVIVDRVLPMHTSLLKSASVLCSVWTVSFAVTLGSARMSSINLTTRSRPACCCSRQTSLFL